MDICLDIDLFKKNYRIKEEKKGLIHKVGNTISIFPYNTKFENKYKEDIQNFICAVGEFCRISYKKRLNSKVINLSDLDIFIDKINIKDQDKISLKSIIKELFFAENKIYIFHPIIFNYIYVKKNDYNNNLAKFLFDILIGNKDNQILEKMKKCFEYKPINILEKLILDGLPKLEEYNESVNIHYKGCVNFVKQLFLEDLSFILESSKSFTKEFEKLLKYYYFFYVSQLSLKLSKFCKMEIDKVEELYFNLDWESTSKSRTSYINGWKLLESNINTLFSHANTLEILNCNRSKDKYCYFELKQIYDLMDEDKQKQFISHLSDIIQIYKENITDVDWDKLFIEKKFDDDIDQIIYELYRTIDFQFKESSRKKPYQGYKKWFEEFCKVNFLKRRGSLGYTLNITEEYLLFITKLCIKNREKVRLKDLFNEYKKRGLYFDRDSQVKIVQLFEKLNLIEKKSDSGDAQYVKAVL